MMTTEVTIKYANQSVDVELAELLHEEVMADAVERERRSRSRSRRRAGARSAQKRNESARKP